MLRATFILAATALLTGALLTALDARPFDHSPLLLVATGAAPVNLVLFTLYGWDKRAARRDTRRIPERLLHLGAACGGWLGAWLAQRAFRHKTRKRAFRRVFYLTALPNLAYVATLTAALLRS